MRLAHEAMALLFNLWYSILGDKTKGCTMNRTSATLLLFILLCLHVAQRVECAESKLVKPMADGSLDMLPWNEQGDRIPDFSYCGYRNGGVKIPDVPTLVTLEPSGADTEYIWGIGYIMSISDRKFYGQTIGFGIRASTKRSLRVCFAKRKFLWYHFPEPQ